MRLATYNLRKGGPRRVHWARLIEDHAVDLLLVQESFAPDEHLPAGRDANRHGPSVWQTTRGKRWGSGIYSSSGTLTPVHVPGFSGWVVGAELTGAAWQTGFADPLLVFSVHTPLRTGTYATQTSRILDRIRRIAARRDAIIGGDFNLIVSSPPESARPTHARELAIQTRLADRFQLLNCWLEANPGQPAAQTLRWTGNPTVPYHCDGLFVPKTWGPRLTSCVVLAGDEWQDLSDHYPVVATFSS